VKFLYYTLYLVSWCALVKAEVNSGQTLVNIVKMVKQEGQNWELNKN